MLTRRFIPLFLALSLMLPLPLAAATDDFPLPPGDGGFETCVAERVCIEDGTVCIVVDPDEKVCLEKLPLICIIFGVCVLGEGCYPLCAKVQIQID